MEMLICQTENGFSSDELVKKLSDAFENKAFAEILKMNFQLTQEVLINRILNKTKNQTCCADGYLMLNGSLVRRIRTCLGEFVVQSAVRVLLRWQNYKCIFLPVPV